MTGWRSKMLGYLFIYFLGFATAIYVAVPGSKDLAEDRTGTESPASFAERLIKSDDFAVRFREGMDRCAEIGREASDRLGELLKQEYRQQHP